MFLTVLGQYGPYPPAGGACSGYLLSSDSGKTNLLLDCGCGILPRMQKANALDGLTGVVLTHLHYDHMSDMLPMQYYLQFNPRQQGLVVYAPQSPAAVRALLDVPAFDVLSPRDDTIGEMRLRFIPATHPVEAVSVCVECDGTKFVYTGDTNENNLISLFSAGADVLLADAGLMEADWSETAPHLSAKRAGKLAKEAGVKRLYLTHFNPKYNPEDIAREAGEVFPGAQIVKAGARIYI